MDCLDKTENTFSVLSRQSLLLNNNCYRMYDGHSGRWNLWSRIEHRWLSKWLWRLLWTRFRRNLWRNFGYRLGLYRVEHQTLPVEFFLNFYRILEEMNMKIGTDDPLVLSYDIIKGWNIDSASVSIMTKINSFSILLKNCHILYVHEFSDFYFS